MAINLASIKRVSADRPPMILIHGGPGIGKTTFAAAAPDAVFLRTEDGLGNLEASAFPLAKSFQDIMEALSSLYTEEHNFRWVVIDSLSALEPLIWQAVARAEGKNSVEDLSFGKGYVIALDYWRQLLDGLSALATEKKIGVILIAHSDVVRYDSPEMEAYDRLQIKLHKRAFQLMYERCDVIGYAAPRVFLRKDGEGKSARNLGVGSGERLLHLVEKPAFVAKNRYRLPESLPLDWEVFHGALMAAVAPKPAAVPAAKAA